MNGVSQMDSRLRKYALSAVPRYTSYPTAPHFQKDFDPSLYASWLEALDTNTPISLYVHIPYCRHLCWYCGCNMKLARHYSPVADYVDILLREIDLVREFLPGRLPVSHLHFGGGTPTTLEPDDLDRIMKALLRNFAFLTDAECAIEGDPRTMTRDMADRISALGFMRASFGIQEFDPKVQEAINRIQPPEMVHRAVDDLRDVGVAAINFDLIYGLPHQTTEALARTVDHCIAMSPDRIALFGYAHVPWMAKKQKLIDEAALPGAQERFQQAEQAAQILNDAGYERVGLDHFALPNDPLARAARSGHLHRNFQGYTTDAAQTLLGFGTTAIGRTPGGYVQNCPERRAWASAICQGVLPIAKGHTLSDDDRLRGHIIERLMCDGVADLAHAAGKFSAEAGWDQTAREELAPMVEEGLVLLTGDTVAVTELGRPVLRTIAAAFDTYRQRSVARHSLAV